MANKMWTQSEIDEFLRRYPDELTADLAADLGRSVKACYSRAKILGIGKSETFFASSDSGRTDGTRGLSSRFQKGQESWNKGNKGYDAGGRSSETRFKPGQRPANWVPIGTEITDQDGYLKRKTRDDSPPGQSRLNWQFVHVLVWEEHHGARPRGHSIVFKDGDRRNLEISNLECISRSELMKRNTVHNLPDELVDVIRTKGVLTRQINKRRRAACEEQN